MKNRKNASAAVIRHIGWKYYNLAKKKAMEQESSWSGLLTSLSIAFFVVLICAQTLNFTYETIAAKRIDRGQEKEKIYYLESAEHVNNGLIDNLRSEHVKLNLNKYIT